MFAFIRTIVYVSLVISVLLVSLSGSRWSATGFSRPETPGAQQTVGWIIGVAGVALALWCVVLFAARGRGTPLPFDPPRRLVTEGPYRIVRNPMALGVGSALLGVSIFYESWTLLGYTGLFFLIIHLFVVLYEEPTLRETFGDAYEAYCARVGRWWPRVNRR